MKRITLIFSTLLLLQSPLVWAKKSIDAGNPCQPRPGEQADAEIVQLTRAIDTGDLPNVERARAYFQRGSAWLTKGSPDCAISDLDKAIIVNSRLVEAFVSRGIAWSVKHDEDRALTNFDAATRVNPNHAPAFLFRGMARQRRGEVDGAIEDFGEAIRLEPRYVTAYVKRGYAWAHRKDYKKSIADFSKAIELEPKSSQRYVARANIYDNDGEPEKADADYTYAIKLDPKNADAYAQRAIARINNEQYQEANEDFETSLRLQPENLALYKSRARVRFHLDKFQLSIEDGVQALKSDNDPYVMIWLYMARTRSGVDGASELAGYIKRLPSTAWPVPVVDVLLGRIAPSVLMKKAENPDARIRQEQICEARFYLGFRYLSRGDKKNAIALLEQAERECPRGFVERTAAKHELKRLNSPQSK